jgi:outer membrane protein TolC
MINGDSAARKSIYIPLLLIGYYTTPILGHSQSTHQLEQQYRKEINRIYYSDQATEQQKTVPSQSEISLSFDQCIEHALKNNNDIKNSITQYKKSLLNYQLTLFQFDLSGGSLNYNTRYDHQDGTTSNSLSNRITQSFRNGVELQLGNDITSRALSNQKIDFFDTTSLKLTRQLWGSTQLSNDNTILSAIESMLQAKISLNDAITNTIKNVENQYYTTVFEQDAFKKNSEVLNTIEKSLQKSEIEYQIGDISLFDLENMKNQKISTSLAIKNQEIQLLDKIKSLKDSLNISPDTTLNIENINIDQHNIPSPTELSTSYQQDIVNTLLKNSDLINSKIRILQMERALRIKEKNKRINATVGGSLSYNTDTQTADNSIGITLQQPIDQRDNNNDIKATLLSLEIEKTNFLNSCATAIRQVENLQQTMLANYEQINLSEKQLQSTEKINAGAKIKFKYGDISAIDLQQSNQSYIDAVQTLKNNKINHLKTINDYKQTTYGLLDSIHTLRYPQILREVFSILQDDITTRPRFKLHSDSLEKQHPQKLCHQLIQSKIAYP